LGREFVVGEPLQRRFHRVDDRNRLAVLLEQAVVAASEELGEEIGGHMNAPGTPSPGAWVQAAMIDRKDAGAPAVGDWRTWGPPAPADTRLSRAKPPF